MSIKKDPSPSDTLTREMMRNNEIKTNQRLSLFLLIFVLYPVMNLFLLKINFNFFPSMTQVNSTILLPFAIDVGAALMAIHLAHFRGAWVKNVLFLLLLLCCNAYYFFLPGYCSFLVLLPLYLSARYFKRSFFLKTSIITLFSLICVCIASYMLDSRIELVHEIHITSYYNPWSDFTDTFVLIIVPLFLIAVFIVFYAQDITLSGQRFIRSQAEQLTTISANAAELSMAARVQSGALPSKSYRVPDGSFSILAMEETAREVGGDFYDYALLKNGLLMVLIADVSDKGFAAAMFMMSARKALRCAIECSPTLEEAIELANRLICEDNRDDMFLTLWLALIDTHSGSGCYVNAGHLPPYLCHANGSVEVIVNEPDLFLGCLADQVPAVHPLQMREGDTLVLYTDGITDNMNKEEERYGEKRLKEVLQNTSGDAQSFHDAILSSSKDFLQGKEQYDDMTLLLLQRHAVEKPKTMSLTVPASLEKISVLQDQLQDFLRNAGVADSKRRDMGVIADEIACNVVSYAYPDHEGEMRLDVLLRGHCCELTFTDEGIPFDPLKEQAELPEFPQLGGYGIFLARILSSDMTYQRNQNQNILCVQVELDDNHSHE